MNKQNGEQLREDTHVNTESSTQQPKGGNQVNAYGQPGITGWEGGRKLCAKDSRVSLGNAMI